MPLISAETGGSLWVGSQPGLCSEFQASQGCIVRPFLKSKQQRQKFTPPKVAYDIEMIGCDPVSLLAGCVLLAASVCQSV